MELSYKFIVIIFAVLAYVNCQTLDVNALKAQFKQISYLNQNEVDFEEQCRKNGGPNISLTYPEKKLSTCVTEYLVSSMKQEYTTWDRAESLRVKIERACKYEHGAHDCIDQYANTIKSCLNETTKEIFDEGLKIIYNTVQFVCYRKGDRIARFMEEGGPRCAEERQVGLQNCLMQVSTGLQVPNDTRPSESLPTLTFVTAQNCKAISQLKTCVYDQFIQCSNNSPASIVNDFIQFLEEQLTCRPVTYLSRTAADNYDNTAATSTTTTWNIALLLVISALSLLFKS